MIKAGVFFGRSAAMSWMVVGIPGVTATLLRLLAADTAGTTAAPVPPLSGPGPPETAPSGVIEGNSP